jgi:hypothetical protein
LDFERYSRGSGEGSGFFTDISALGTCSLEMKDEERRDRKHENTPDIF